MTGDCGVNCNEVHSPELGRHFEKSHLPQLFEKTICGTMETIADILAVAVGQLGMESALFRR